MLDSSPLRAPPIEYEIVGNPAGPLVVVLGGISADRHVCAHSGDDRAGWWDSFVGPGRPVDTTHCQVLSFDYLSGDSVVTTDDQARCLADVLYQLGLEAIDLLIGASYGGMVGLAFASLFPDRLGRALVIGAAHESHPMATALRAIQRRIVRLGLETGDEAEAMAIARALAITTYRTASEFRGRFSNLPDESSGELRFPVEDYLDYQGRKFADRFSSERFLCLSESLDLHRVDPATITTPVTLVAIEEDAVVPAWQVRELYCLLGAGHGLIEIHSQYGHDAFLKETQAISSILNRTLEKVSRQHA
ncbi:MAG TPA: homoserine O-succinyltransferase [Longimicrobiaceae bacterium]|nr:homoserine O-succinyltransferase [Longimicrobiaceae bacterium]